MSDTAEALREAGRANLRVDGLQKEVSGLREDFKHHAQDNADQHRENKRTMEAGFDRVHTRVDAINQRLGRAALGIISLLIAVLGYLIANGLPWQ